MAKPTSKKLTGSTAQASNGQTDKPSTTGNHTSPFETKSKPGGTPVTKKVKPKAKAPVVKTKPGPAAPKKSAKISKAAPQPKSTSRLDTATSRSAYEDYLNGDDLFNLDGGNRIFNNNSLFSEIGHGARRKF